MDWQEIVMIVVTALLLLVWLPALIISVRKVLLKEKKNQFNKTNSDGSKA